MNPSYDHWGVVAYLLVRPTQWLTGLGRSLVVTLCHRLVDTAFVVPPDPGFIDIGFIQYSAKPQPLPPNHPWTDGHQ
ncbi:MAG TPA: hypothetical protein ACQGQI_10740 [Xylella sp.]